MGLVLYNTLTKKKEIFKPLETGKVKMYVCGPTVYDFLHIGNFRGPIFFNLVRNWLEETGHEVTYVYNYTDVDDKIIKRANDENVQSSDISERFIAEFEKDYSNLGLRKHTHNPRVTEHIDTIINTVQKIIERGNAYVIDGEVFYTIESFKDYGKLSGKKIDELEAGQRVEVDQRKNNPADFVLWKPSKEGEPSWDSPWGKGRPGWHIECSAMIRSILGESIDIHGGGIDLIFPHHENEIAQGEGACDHKYCTYWMHNEFINLKDQKMSKSLGNVILGRSFMEKYHPEILKFLMLSSHYRTMLGINEEKIDNTISGLARVYKALRDADQVIANSPAPKESGSTFKALATGIETHEARIKKALNDDFNTGEMMANIYEVVRLFNAQNTLKKLKDPNALVSAKEFKTWVLKWGKISALFQENPTEFLQKLDDILMIEKSIDRQQVQSLIDQRNMAREEKDWAKSDEARDKLKELGIEIQDGPNGTIWEVSK